MTLTSNFAVGSVLAEHPTILEGAFALRSPFVKEQVESLNHNIKFAETEIQLLLSRFKVTPDQLEKMLNYNIDPGWCFITANKGIHPVPVFVERDSAGKLRQTVITMVVSEDDSVSCAFFPGRGFEVRSIRKGSTVTMENPVLYSDEKLVNNLNAVGVDDVRLLLISAFVQSLYSPDGQNIRVEEWDEIVNSIDTIQTESTPNPL